MDQRQRQSGGRAVDGASTRGKHGKTVAAPQRDPFGPTALQRAAQGLASGVVSEDTTLALQHGIGNAAFHRALVAVQRAEGDHAGGAEAATAQRSLVDTVLSSPGRPLDAPLRSEMETRLGADFSDVRVHTDSAAREMVAGMGARAVTSGNHIAIGADGGDPHTLAHELSHVIQQRQGPVAGTDNGHGLSISDPSDRFERAAEENARRVLSEPLPGAAETPSPAPAPEHSPSSAASVQRAPSAHGAAPLPVQRMDAGGYGGYGYGGAGGGYPAPQAPEPAPELTPKQVRDTIAAWGDQPPMVSYSARRQGRAHAEFHMRFPRDWVGEEAEQTLSDTSALLFDSTKGAREQTGVKEPSHAPEREVQGMLLNDRLVFASNLNSSLDNLVAAGTRRGRHNRAVMPTLEELLRIEQTERARTDKMSERERINTRKKMATARAKNEAIFSGQRGEGEQERGEDATAKALRAKMGEPVIVVNVEDGNLRELLTSPEYEGRVFFLRFKALDPKSSKSSKSKDGVTEEKAMHAEQKLLLALSYAGINPRKDVKGPISIMGKYRPCMGCAAALRYYRERLGFGGLRFDENYGHLFQGAVDTLRDHHRHIMDGHYLEYIRQMIHDDITSTPAMMEEAPPENAEYSRGGYRIRVPGHMAAKRADVTPSQSDAEIDEEGRYLRVKRPLDQTWEFETAPSGIGPGTEHHEVPRRKHEVLDETEKEELQTLWFGTQERPTTNENRQKAIELFDEYNAKGMTFEYLAKASGRSQNRINADVAEFRSSNKQHRTHVPSKSTRTVTEKAPASARKFKKGDGLDNEVKKILKEAIRSQPNHPWSMQWERLHSEVKEKRRMAEAEGRELKAEDHVHGLRAVDAPEEVLMTLARIQSGERRYDVGSLSRYLHTGEGRDKLKSGIRKGKSLLDGASSKGKGKAVDTKGKGKSKQSAVRVKSEDVEMADASGYPAYPEYPAQPAAPAAPSYVSYEQPTRRLPQPTVSAWTNPYEQGAGSSSAGHAPQVAETVPGFVRQDDPSTGQTYFLDPTTGTQYVRIDGQMVALRDDENDVDMAG